MTTFREYDSVIYTDSEGKLIDTFVVYDTDATTGLTHINYLNLKVKATQLKLHAKSREVNHLPVSDLYSLELLRRLKAKFKTVDRNKNIKQPVLHAVSELSQAS